MEDNVGKYHIINGKLTNSSNFEGTKTLETKEIYEVIRIISGVPLFIDDHYKRMVDSVEAIAQKMCITLPDMKQQIEELITANNLYNCNVKVTAAYNSRAIANMTLYISKSYYPSEEVFRKGVAVGTINLERQSPSIKQINYDYKKAVNSRISEGGFFEVLLCNPEGNITEGSRSNVFFISGNMITTAPGYSVLMGITRQYVFEACKTAGYEVMEDFINVKSLSEIDGIFLSGTSIKVLPVASVDEFTFNSSTNPVINAVAIEYNQILNKYIEKGKKK